MLSDYIQPYIEARKNADKPKMEQIEREVPNGTNKFKEAIANQ